MEDGQKWNEFTEAQLKQLEARKWSDILNDMAELRADVREMKAAFQQAKGALVLVKWGSAVVVALAGGCAWLSTHVNWKG